MNSEKATTIRATTEPRTGLSADAIKYMFNSSREDRTATHTFRLLRLLNRRHVLVPRTRNVIAEQQILSRCECPLRKKQTRQAAIRVFQFHV